MTSSLQRTYDEIACAALARYDDVGDEPPTLLSVSENATYLVEGSFRKMVLRVHRDGYHTRNQIESELAWSQDMRGAGAVETAAVIPSRSGDRVEVVGTADGSAWRHCVMFEFLEGVEPAEGQIVQEFERLGVIAARMHQFTKAWTPPARFDRMIWNYETILGNAPHWGRWQDGRGVEGAGMLLLERTAEVIRQHLERYGTGQQRFGLIHADMRLANLLLSDATASDETARDTTSRVIDFDDCGFSWYMYDVAAALSFIEDRSDTDDAIEQWIHGYQQVAPLSAEDVAIIPTLVMMRRMLLVAWLGSHPSADMAKELGTPFTEITCTLADRYLSTQG